ncbi:MAG: hypothetical protein KAS32_10905 [Candidatus Peribacteraceae bacterium]|nr:hypothetical protein [Candidatus Peribacteraceae bacterium]
MAITGTVLAVTTAASFQQQRKARKERQKASAVERRQAEVTNLRSRQKALAERLRAGAEAESAAQAVGIGPGSSVVAAEKATLGSQFGANVGFSQELEQLAAQRTSFLEEAAAKASRAQTFQQVGTIAVQGKQAFDIKKARTTAALEK